MYIFFAGKPQLFRVGPQAPCKKWCAAFALEKRFRNNQPRRPLNSLFSGCLVVLVVLRCLVVSSVCVLTSINISDVRWLLFLGETRVLTGAPPTPAQNGRLPLSASDKIDQWGDAGGRFIQRGDGRQNRPKVVQKLIFRNGEPAPHESACRLSRRLSES